jgi:hypothetical protein
VGRQLGEATLNTKGSGNQDTIKRTYILPKALVRRLEDVAKQERRPIGRQLEIFLERALELHDAERGEKLGQYRPVVLRAA